MYSLYRQSGITLCVYK